MYFCGVPYYKSLIGADKMVKVRIEGLPEEVEKFTEQLKKDGYHFLMESDDYPNRNSEYVRRYVEIRLKEQSNLDT